MAIPQVSPRISLKNILFATDFTSASDAALPYAAALADWYGAKVVVAHAVSPEPMLEVPMDVTPRDIDFSWQNAEKKMAAFLARDPLHGVPAETALQQGQLWDVLCKVIHDRSIDLVVVGTHGRAGLRKIALGSVAEEVIRRAPCPVLTVGPHALHQAGSFEKWKCILFATDFSAGSLNALPYALSFAEENQARLIIVHEIPLVPVQEQESVRENTRKRLEFLFPPDASEWCTPEFIVGFDFAGEGILRIAEQRGADLIVMGVHATSSPWVSAHMPWAVAHEIICEARCPVMTVRG